MDIPALEQRRLDAEADRPAANIDAAAEIELLHHVAQVSGDNHAALAGYSYAFDRQQLAADIRPCKARDDANLVVRIDLAKAILRNTEKLLEEFFSLTFTAFFFVSVSSFTALRASVDNSRSRLRTPASRAYRSIIFLSAGLRCATAALLRQLFHSSREQVIFCDREFRFR